jgi:hypothetical protein
MAKITRGQVTKNSRRKALEKNVIAQLVRG